MKFSYPKETLKHALYLFSGVLLHCPALILVQIVIFLDPFYRFKGVAKLIHKNNKMKTPARKNILKRLTAIAPSMNLGLHSLRSGGATMEAQSNVNERCLKRHGRWR